MFLINSRLGLFTVAASSSRGKPVHRWRHPFSRSYGAVLPSSLTMVLPIASVYSTRPPVSVLVWAPDALLRGFSWKHGLADFTQSLRLASRDMPALVSMRGLPTGFHGDVQNPAELPFFVTPSVKRRVGGAGMSTCCASATPSGLALAPD